MLTAKQIEVAVKNFVSVCNEHLFAKSLGGYRPLVDNPEVLPDTEENVAKAFAMNFKKAWWTEPHDVKLMSNMFANSLPKDITVERFLAGIVDVSLSMNDVSEWNTTDYPYLAFDIDPDMTPYYITLLKRNTN